MAKKIIFISTSIILFLSSILLILWGTEIFLKSKRESKNQKEGTQYRVYSDIELQIEIELQVPQNEFDGDDALRALAIAKINPTNNEEQEGYFYEGDTADLFIYYYLKISALFLLSISWEEAWVKVSDATFETLNYNFFQSGDKLDLTNLDERITSDAYRGEFYIEYFDGQEEINNSGIIDEKKSFSEVENVINENVFRIEIFDDDDYGNSREIFKDFNIDEEEQEIYFYQFDYNNENPDDEYEKIFLNEV